MKEKFMVIFLIGSIGLSASADLRDLKSLPKNWRGQAGDLVVRVDASLVISEIKSVVTDGKSPDTDYEVKASINFGSRTVEIQRITLRNYSLEPMKNERVEVTLRMKDELVPVLSGLIVRDFDQDIITLKDVSSPPNGRRLFLKGI